jgi:hypothetical protein
MFDSITYGNLCKASFVLEIRYQVGTAHTTTSFQEA